MQQLSSSFPLPPFAHEPRADVVSRFRSAVFARLTVRSWRARSPGHRWFEESSMLPRSLPVWMRIPRLTGESPAADAVPCPTFERLLLVALVVVLYALLAALGLSVAAMPMLVGGAGVAAMVIWIGWYWADEA
jgi:hypothetical protein